MISNFSNWRDEQDPSVLSGIITSLNPRNALEQTLAWDIAIAAARLYVLRKRPATLANLELELKLRSDWLESIDTYYSIRSDPEFTTKPSPARPKRPRSNPGLHVVPESTTDQL
jgi:hypothetical protein